MAVQYPHRGGCRLTRVARISRWASEAYPLPEDSCSKARSTWDWAMNQIKRLARGVDGAVCSVRRTSPCPSLVAREWFLGRCG